MKSCLACAVAEVTAAHVELPAGPGRTEYVTALSHVMVLGAEKVIADLCPSCAEHEKKSTAAFRAALPAEMR